MKPTGLVAGHYECRSFEQTIPILTDLLALEVETNDSGRLTLKHPNTAWRLIAHEGGPNSPNKPLRNHYGVRVASNKEVDHANAYLEAKKKELGLKIMKPREYHNAYSVHFLEPGGNFWEIESYENAIKVGMGKTTDPHWKDLMPEERFPGKGYVPQALSHGTIEIGDLDATRKFYENVLGLEVVQLWPSAIYLKHPDTPWYIVNLQAPPENRKYLGRHQRFTLSVDSVAALEDAHAQLKANSASGDITEIEEIRRDPHQALFLFCDLNKNWWELTDSRQ